jgi:hypothetical protein
MASALRVLLALVCVAGCTPPEGPEMVELVGQVMAGPTCPVQRDPPDPTCDDRPVAGAEVIVLDADGEVARIRSDDAGAFRLALPSGEYRLVPQPVDGLMGTAPPVDVVLEVGVPEPVRIVYDTGIR